MIGKEIEQNVTELLKNRDGSHIIIPPWGIQTFTVICIFDKSTVAINLVCDHQM